MIGRRTVARAGAVALAVAVPVAGWSGLPATAAQAPVPAPPPAARSFSAQVTVQWLEGDRRYVTALQVRAADGLVRVEGARQGGGGDLVLGDDWLLVAPGGKGLAVTPAMERKYDIERQPGPEVAGRPTSLMVFRTGGRLRERLAVDEGTGLVLRRELFGRDGEAVRVVTVTGFDGSAPSLPAGRPAADQARRMEPEALGDLYRSPATLAGGFERVSAYRRGPVVHVLYSDGLHGLSLFVQPGKLDRDRLPAGGRAVALKKAGALRYTWAGGEIITWQAGPVVRTLVGDAAPDEVLAAARSLPGAPRASLLGRFRGACREVAEVLSGG